MTLELGGGVSKPFSPLRYPVFAQTLRRRPAAIVIGAEVMIWLIVVGRWSGRALVIKSVLVYAQFFVSVLAAVVWWLRRCWQEGGSIRSTGTLVLRLLVFPLVLMVPLIWTTLPEWWSQGDPRCVGSNSLSPGAAR